ncbi:MAG: HlyD family type I secretion periplasmic adaptor subunit [Gammaproteobacteria bacterium]|nr:MAG: HlyD family type I secretion periplasmic adaptor subunit [Gammaproteobacteria bacterium]
MKQEDSHSYHPALIRLQQTPPSPLRRHLLWTLLLLLLFVIAWMAIGRLDIVAVAPGQLVPSERIKIIQPAEAGIVRRILVREGQKVAKGQVLMQMEALEAEADIETLRHKVARERLALRRLQAELQDRPMQALPEDPPADFADAAARCEANRRAHETALAEAHSELRKAKRERAVALQQQQAIAAVLPSYREEEEALAQLAAKGHTGKLQAAEKRRKRIEQEQQLATQRALVSAAEAGIELWQHRIERIAADHRQRLHEEQAQHQTRLLELARQLKKLRNRREHLVLRAPQDGIIKDLATHTDGTVVQPGTILATLVPEGDDLEAEVWISNADIGFVHPGQTVQLKLAAYPFQRYGILPATLVQVSADARRSAEDGTPAAITDREPARYRALARLHSQQLASGGTRHALAPGMQLQAEIMLGSRSIADYLLSPVQAAWQEAGRER